MPAFTEYGTRTLTRGGEVNWSLGSNYVSVLQIFLYTNGWATENQYRGFLTATYSVSFSIGLRSYRQQIGGVWNQAQWFWPDGKVFTNRIYFKASNAVPSGATMFLAIYA